MSTTLLGFDCCSYLRNNVKIDDAINGGKYALVLETSQVGFVNLIADAWCMTETISISVPARISENIVLVDSDRGDLVSDCFSMNLNLPSTGWRHFCAFQRHISFSRTSGDADGAIWAVTFYDVYAYHAWDRSYILHLKPSADIFLKVCYFSQNDLR